MYKLEILSIPEIKSTEVLVKVAYAAINPLEKLTINGSVKLIGKLKCLELLVMNSQEQLLK